MRQLLFVARQAALMGLAAVGYFGVRGLTEGKVELADRHARQVLRIERWLGIDFEIPLQEAVLRSDFAVDIANWIYIWGHWPVVIATLVWLAVRHRPDFYELRNAMFISGAIGLLIYATYAVTPPRLLAIDYIDTVTENSSSYRVLQPPGLVNKYAAVPSLHFGWNLLVGLSWRRVNSNRLAAVASVAMPVAMGFAVVATANHWVFDVLAGTVVALAGLFIERARRSYLMRRQGPAAAAPNGGPRGDAVPPTATSNQGLRGRDGTADGPVLGWTCNGLASVECDPASRCR